MDLAAFVQQIAAGWGEYLRGVVALSTLTMAILQTVKDITPIRRVFHSWFVMRWLLQKGNGRARAAEEDLVNLTTDGDRHAFYDLATEQMCGQISAAAQVVLEYPMAHADLLYCLSGGNPDGSKETLVAVQGPVSRMFSTAKLLPDESARQLAEEQAQRVAEARARMLLQIQRSIDGLQITALYRWKMGFQLASFVLCFSIAYAVTRDQGMAKALFVGLSAGFLAPVARDLLAKLQQIK